MSRFGLGFDLALLAAILLAGWRGVAYLENRGYNRCQGEVALAKGKAEEEGLATYKAAMAWGTQVSTQLAEAQRINADLRVNHGKAASHIPGMCPVGLLNLHDAAAKGAFIPDPTGASLRAPGFIAASAIGDAVADNYAACRDCEDKLRGWIDFWSGINWEGVCR